MILASIKTVPLHGSAHFHRIPIIRLGTDKMNKNITNQNDGNGNKGPAKIGKKILNKF